jgi:hypothetical protein
MVRTAAANDEHVARAVNLFAMRAVPVTGLLNPKVLLRSAVVARRVRRSGGTAARGRVPVA